MDNNFDTLEKAQAEILRLNGELTKVTGERDTLSEDNKKLTGHLEDARKHNQSLFNQLTAQNTKQEDEDPEEDETPLSCEEFAKTLTI